mmetsp:Transcript_11161/g.27226  ORF Transcript_11161/g.27226 Transcript_11161/m.27226 type:complete len:265 (-) Transcript_11161:3025-3819(-)
MGPGRASCRRPAFICCWLACPVMLLFPTANVALFILFAIPCTRTSESWRMYLRSCRVMNCCRMDRVVGTERRPSLRLAAISAMVVRNAMKSGPSLPYVSTHIAMNKKCFSVASVLYVLFFCRSSLRTAAPSSVAVPEAHAYGLTPSIGWTMDTSPSTAITSFRMPVTHMSVMLSWSRSFALRACSFGPSSAAHLGVAWRPVPCLTILMSWQRTSLWQRVRLPNWLLYLQLIAWCPLRSKTCVEHPATLQHVAVTSSRISPGWSR